MKSPKQIAENRPAETATAVTGSVAYLIAWGLGVDDEPAVVLAIVAVVAFMPTAVTWLVETVKS